MFAVHHRPAVVVAGNVRCTRATNRFGGGTYVFQSRWNTSSRNVDFPFPRRKAHRNHDLIPPCVSRIPSRIPRAIRNEPRTPRVRRPDPLNPSSPPQKKPALLNQPPRDPRRVSPRTRRARSARPLATPVARCVCVTTSPSCYPRANSQPPKQARVPSRSPPMRSARPNPLLRLSSRGKAPSSAPRRFQSQWV